MPNNPLFNSLTLSLALFSLSYLKMHITVRKINQLDSLWGNTSFPEIETELGRMILQKGRKRGQFLTWRGSWQFSQLTDKYHQGNPLIIQSITVSQNRQLRTRSYIVIWGQLLIKTWAMTDQNL